MLAEMWNLHESVITHKWTALILGRVFWRLPCEVAPDAGKQMADGTTQEGGFQKYRLSTGYGLVQVDWSIQKKHKILSTGDERLLLQEE